MKSLLNGFNPYEAPVSQTNDIVLGSLRNRYFGLPYSLILGHATDFLSVLIRQHLQHGQAW